MTRYSPERKEAVLKKLLPPYSRSVAEVAKEEGIHTGTLYNWKKALRESGAVVPDSNTSSEDVDAYIRYYNHERLHTTLGNLAPINYEKLQS